jgi:hypothetical protein
MDINAKMTADVVGLAKLPHLEKLVFGDTLPAEYVDTEWDEGQKCIDKEEEEYLSELEDALESRIVPLFKASSTTVYWYQLEVMRSD